MKVSQSKKNKRTYNKKSNRKSKNKKSKLKVDRKKSQMGGKISKKCQCIDYDLDQKNNLLIVTGINGTPCQRNAVSGTNFCSKHQNCTGFLKLYRSGYEPNYDPKEWEHPYVEASHNCYTYFLNNQVKSLESRCKKLCHKKSKNCPKKVSECGDLKPQPGDFHLLVRDGNLKKKKRKYTCQDMEAKVLKDNPSIKPTKLFNKCPKGSYKGALVIDPDHTYHFYRQDKNGLWSHKPGTLAITNLDASGKLIYAPHLADRDYSKDKNNKDDAINYTNFCNYYCIPDKKIVDLHSI